MGKVSKFIDRLTMWMGILWSNGFVGKTRRMQYTVDWVYFLIEIHYDRLKSQGLILRDTQIQYRGPVLLC